MKAAKLYGPGSLQIDTVPDPVLRRATDAIVRVVRAGICGSDLQFFRTLGTPDEPITSGHEFVGVIEETGANVPGLRPGDVVISSFTFQDNTCELCDEGLQTSCPQGGFLNAAQAEYIRVPLAAGTLVRVPVDEDSPLLASLLTLTDVYSTGWHAAERADIGPQTTVTVIGDGAVGLLAVLSARQRGAEKIILMGRHPRRTSLGREFGATDVVGGRGDEGIEQVREMTRGAGTHAVIEAAGSAEAYRQAVGVVRSGGVISRVGIPEYEYAQVGFNSLFSRNVTLTGGLAPVRRYMEKLLPAVLEGQMEPGRVFDRTVRLDETPSGYLAMARREALKVLIRP